MMTYPKKGFLFSGLNALEISFFSRFTSLIAKVKVKLIEIPISVSYELPVYFTYMKYRRGNYSNIKSLYHLGQSFSKYPEDITSNLPKTNVGFFYGCK